MKDRQLFEPIYSLQPHGNSLWVLGEKIVIELDPQRLETISNWPLELKGLKSDMVVLKDEVWIGIGSDIIVWSRDAHCVTTTLSSHSQRIFGLELVPDTEIWSCSFDKTIVRWNIEVCSTLTSRSERRYKP